MKNIDILEQYYNNYIKVSGMPEFNNFGNKECIESLIGYNCYLFSVEFDALVQEWKTLLANIFNRMNK